MFGVNREGRLGELSAIVELNDGEDARNCAFTNRLAVLIKSKTYDDIKSGLFVSGITKRPRL